MELFRSMISWAWLEASRPQTWEEIDQRGAIDHVSLCQGERRWNGPTHGVVHTYAANLDACLHDVTRARGHRHTDGLMRWTSLKGGDTVKLNAGHEAKAIS